MSQRVFEIDELARLVSHHLVSTNRESAVSLACTCRLLEVPVLSSLWELQDSLLTLIGALPMMDEEVTEHDSSENTWRRFRRYASWMRRLLLREEDERWATDDIFNHLLAGSTGGLVCPNLRHLTCYLTTTNARFIPHFLSPHLTHLTIRVRPIYQGIVRGLPPDLGPILQILPTPCLREISIDLGLNGMDHLKDKTDSMIRRCGDSLRVLSIPIPLGEAAVCHILRLKHLRIWDRVCSLPPATLPPSATFPPLQTLILNRKEAYGWISRLARRERGISDAHDGSLEYAGLQATLKRLGFCESVPIDATFISPFSLLPNLVILYIRLNCWEVVGCAFSLTNRDIVQLSAALPRLEALDLGPPCPANTCLTTISCFLALSVHCRGLYNSRIHFNTANLVNDIRSLLEDPYFRELRSLPTRCSLKFFFAGSLPFPPGTSDEDVTTIAAGLIDIFPSILSILSHDSPGWMLLRSRVRELQEIKTPLLAGTESPQIRS
ncbi:hypothetical protein BDM02DRAFT_3129189 [Thelephora ganbajun]|uniref:Uncharacterized protein n=1 Tax=Thelephora ganbajun TaxID=370292 RepID=A0ACB6ZF56_THEGA|nr:hypothetical protein BDM02DRAFT_3129189 [Thelephora ganbajun]